MSASTGHAIHISTTPFTLTHLAFLFFSLLHLRCRQLKSSPKLMILTTLLSILFLYLCLVFPVLAFPVDSKAHPHDIGLLPSLVNNHCFPHPNFTMPDAPPNNTEGWWCDNKMEYAFMGFSYEVTACAYSCCPRCCLSLTSWRY